MAEIIGSKMVAFMGGGKEFYLSFPVVRCTAQLAFQGKLMVPFKFDDGEWTVHEFETVRMDWQPKDTLGMPFIADLDIVESQDCIGPPDAGQVLDELGGIGLPGLIWYWLASSAESWVLADA